MTSQNDRINEAIRILVGIADEMKDRVVEQPKKRCIGSEIGVKHAAFSRDHGGRDMNAYLGKEEIQLLFDEMSQRRRYDSEMVSTIEGYLLRVSRGEAAFLTQFGKLTIYAVDAPSHLELGG